MGNYAPLVVVYLVQDLQKCRIFDKVVHDMYQLDDIHIIIRGIIFVKPALDYRIIIELLECGYAVIQQLTAAELFAACRG